MPSLPPETFYFPIEPGPHRMAMGLVTVPEADWFEIDSLYLAQMTERRRLLLNHHDQVSGAVAGSDAARAETLQAVSDHLIARYPNWFHRDSAGLHNCLTGESWDPAAHDPLDLAGRLVQEDLCLVESRPDGPSLTAAVLCFPSRWRLHEKLGRPLAAVHDAVPFYADRLARPVDRFMAHVRPDHIAARLNWSLVDDAALFQPMGKWRAETDLSVTPQNAGDRLFLRVERQTLRRLPVSGAVLFGIRVHVYPLTRVMGMKGAASRLAAAVRELPAATEHYKSLMVFRDALLGWLDQVNATATSVPSSPAARSG